MSRTRDIVLVVVAHSDDETFGAGGAIARHRAEGDEVYALSMTDGVSSRGDVGGAAAARRTSADQAAEALGFAWLDAGDFPDNALDTVPLLDLVRHVEREAHDLSPTIVYTHSHADLNVDHRTVCEAVLTVFRPQPGASWRELRAFEVPSATDYGHPSVTGSFEPNLYVSIEATWDQKLMALRVYDKEIRESPHSRSLCGIEALANLRGHQVGLAKAEAFQVLRRIER